MTEKTREFLNEVDKLCFKYEYEIDAALIEGVPMLFIKGENEWEFIEYIDGDGGFNLPLPDKEGEA